MSAWSSGQRSRLPLLSRQFNSVYCLEKARIGKFRKYDDKIPPVVALIPLPVTTFGAWEKGRRD